MNNIKIFNNPEFGDVRTLEVSDKPEFVAGLGMLLAMYSRQPVTSMTYHHDSDGFEAVEIGFEDGSTRTVNVTADSAVAVMLDVAKALM